MSPPRTLSQDQQDVVRAKVRGLLQGNASFEGLDPERRRELAQGLVEIVGFLADPAAGQDDLAAAIEKGQIVADPRAHSEATGARLSTAQATKNDPGTKLGQRMAEKPNVAGEDFKGSALKAGTEAFSDLVDSVDFPAFVSGLIDGVFNSIVDASIRQMEAYGELVKSVVQSVEEFANEKITQNEARDFLHQKHPGLLSISTTGEGPRLSLNDDADEGLLQQFNQTYNLEQGADLSDEASEAQLVRAAQLEMARSRQKMLSTMVMMGINRIVVTNGMINAKVVFDVKADDRVTRTDSASMHDRKDASSYEYSHGREGGWFSGRRSGSGSNNRHRTTVSSAVDTNSESKAEMKAKLSGEVRVNFKSETVDLNMLASQQEQSAIQGNARQAGPTTSTGRG